MIEKCSNLRKYLDDKLCVTEFIMSVHLINKISETKANLEKKIIKS